MKKLTALPLAFALLVGCGQVQPLDSGLVSSHGVSVVSDLGYPGGMTARIALGSASDSRAVQALAFTGWTIADIYEYDLTLSDVTDAQHPKDLVSLTVVCKEGNAEAVFTHLRPGVKYRVRAIAKGNHGGTAPDTVLNTKLAADGWIDLSQTPVDAGSAELTVTIPVQLDGAYDRSAVIGLVPLSGHTISNAPEAATGSCLTCDQSDRIATGSTRYDSTDPSGTDGDVFNSDGHDRWTNAHNGSAWIERDLPGYYAIDEVDVRHAYVDLRFAPCRSIVLKFQIAGQGWRTVDQVSDSNLDFYSKKLANPAIAKAFRLEMTGDNGWFSATGIVLKGKPAL